mmetsp:Transcript_10027/g.16866  ORF Transcript_10027/g.16866 Transcript_10027/m.16866 type:complete len:285 (-) Transcript_10027:2256-3110(-)
MLELAKECRKLEIFTHVSTSYVNCNRRGVQEEEIYNPGADVDTTVDRIMKMSVQQVRGLESELIGDYPNTYTFTKSLAEKKLLRSLDHVKCVLLRPAIIACSMSEPFPGWTDTISAAGGLTTLIGLGAINLLRCFGEFPLDIIPVDLVSNGILVSSAFGARSSKNIHIFNCSTSEQNPVSLRKYADYGEQAYNEVELNQRLTSRSHVVFAEDLDDYNRRKNLFEVYPLLAMEKVASLPLVGSEAMRKQVKMMMKGSKKFNDVRDMFRHFITNQWFYRNKKLAQV